MKLNGILWSIPEADHHHEGFATYSSWVHLADDTADQVLQIFHFSASAQ
jgi:hypothetical protein